MIKKQIVLGTQSQSRTALIKKYNLDWLTTKNTFDETTYKAKNHYAINKQGLIDMTKELSFHKANSIKNLYSNSIIIGCDTVVFCKGKLLEKPKNLDDAKTMLDFLQNKPQYIFTGVTMIDSSNKKVLQFCETTKLIFNNFTNAQYHYLLYEVNPLSNAGGYEYDDIIAPNTTIIHGSSDNIVGIPIKRILKNLNNF